MSILNRFSLAGRIALVVGGAGPKFGSSISEGLAEGGATVVVASRTLSMCESFADSLRKRSLDASAAAVDITNVESIHRLRDQVLGRFGRLDVLVNSAVTIQNGTFEEQT